MSISTSGHNSVSDVRYDSFLSFPGSQSLSSLRFPWAFPTCTVRSVAEEVSVRLCRFSRSPSVFYDKDELKGDPWVSDLSNAVLQIRGGGVELVLLTAEYLRRKWCLAELRAFMELQKLGRKRADGSLGPRAGEGIDLKIVCLDTVSNIKAALKEHCYAKSVEGVTDFQWQMLRQDASESTRALVLDQICGYVLHHWRERPWNCLGRLIGDCVVSLAEQFAMSTVSPSRVCIAFGFRVSGGTTVEAAFDKAVRDGQFSAENNCYSLSLTLEDLFKTTTDADEQCRKALRSIRRKWVSSAWEWSIEKGRNDISLTQFKEEAVRDLARATRRSERPGSSQRRSRAARSDPGQPSADPTRNDSVSSSLVNLARKAEELVKDAPNYQIPNIKREDFAKSVANHYFHAGLMSLSFTQRAPGSDRRLSLLSTRSGHFSPSHTGFISAFRGRGWW